mmetsp:Transcript_33209/g.91536  ORF Transcript_33209/g.91536 Transcript_33209/m.91536 type:complete len:215 (-) Transcript_33209:1047-1691(-)
MAATTLKMLGAMHVCVDRVAAAMLEVLLADEAIAVRRVVDLLVRVTDLAHNAGIISLGLRARILDAPEVAVCSGIASMRCRVLPQHLDCPLEVDVCGAARGMVAQAAAAVALEQLHVMVHCHVFRLHLPLVTLHDLARFREDRVRPTAHDRRRVNNGDVRVVAVGPRVRRVNHLAAQPRWRSIRRLLAAGKVQKRHAQSMRGLARTDVAFDHPQ